MNILVTGGAGFIGSHIVDQLVEEHNVLVIDNLSTGLMQNINPRAIFFRLDIRDPVLDMLFQTFQPEVVFHLAAHISVPNSIADPLTDMKNNIAGSLNLFANCVKYGSQKIIYASSAAVYGNPRYLGLDEKHPISPISFYGVSKYAAEQYLETYSRIYGIRYTILRYANVYGPRQQNSSEAGVVTSVINQLYEGRRPVVFGDGGQTRDFVYVIDIAEATLKAMNAADNEVLNIGSGTETSINELVSTVMSFWESGMEVEYLPPRPGDIRHSYMCNQKARELLAWQPRYTLVNGLSKMIPATICQQQGILLQG